MYIYIHREPTIPENMLSHSEVSDTIAIWEYDMRPERWQSWRFLQHCLFPKGLSPSQRKLFFELQDPLKPPQLVSAIAQIELCDCESTAPRPLLALLLRNPGTPI